MRLVGYALSAVIVLFTSMQLTAQDRPDVPLRYGAHLGLNYNMAGVGYSDWLQLPERPGGSFIPFVLNDGNGLGLYGGLNAQWMLMDILGLQTRLSYDNRSLVAKDDQTHTNSDGSAISDEFTFRTSAVNLEVLAKLYLGDNFHFTGGGGIGIKLQSVYDYRLDSKDPVFTDNEVPGAAITGSAVFGLGYDIPLSDPAEKTQLFLTPFLELSYMMGMRRVDFELQSSLADGLSVVTIRGGVAFTLGDADPNSQLQTSQMGKFFMFSPPEDGIYASRVVEEYFPIRPFVFFDYNSTAIPQRYNNITAADTADLIKHAQSEFSADDITNVQQRKYLQGEIYYNILNLVGYRMNHTPSATLTLIGSDPKEQNGDELAASVKNYLVNTWGIAESRISTKGQIQPNKPSGTARTPAEDLPLADEENRRVEITSNNKDLMRRALLRAERPAREENEIYVKITTNEKIDSWQVTISGNGQRKSYGPFTDDEAYLDPTGLLSSAVPQATFTAEVIAKTSDGRTLSESEQFALKLNNSSARAIRHNLIFEYNDDDPVGRSRDFINAIVPQIPDGSYVIISGHTDNLGTDKVNKKLSQDRANEVKRLLDQALRSAGKRNVRLRATGYGEDPTYAPFTNDRPEGRMYNRTVIVDVIP